jgi:hypothetical protein
MSDLYWLSDAQMARLRPHFPKSHGKPRVDDRRVLSGIIFVNRNGCCQTNANLSPVRRSWPEPRVDQAKTVRHSARAAARLCL